MCNVLYGLSKKSETTANQSVLRRAPLSSRALSKTKLKLLQKDMETFEQKTSVSNMFEVTVTHIYEAAAIEGYM